MDKLVKKLERDAEFDAASLNPSRHVIAKRVKDDWRTKAASALRTQAHEIERLRGALSKLLRFAEGQICLHEETYRGGVMWTICAICGCKWADDEGGFKPAKEPQEITRARAALKGDGDE